MRLNEAGELDSSPPVNRRSDGTIALPCGWVWERFIVSPIIPSGWRGDNELEPLPRGGDGE